MGQLGKLVCGRPSYFSLNKEQFYIEIINVDSFAFEGIEGLSFGNFEICILGA